MKTCTRASRTSYFLALVEIADADEHGVLRQHLRREAADARQFRRLGAEQRGERHAVHVAGCEVVAGVFMSPCASIQSSPIGSSRVLRAQPAAAATEPAARL